MTTAWRWLRNDLIAAVHDRQISEHGGLAGLRDEGALAAALMRPQNLVSYGDPDAADLAASYAFALVKTHPFADGNKRTAWVSVRVFLADNGYSLVFDPFEAVKMVEGLAGGQVTEEAFARWLRDRASRA